MSFPSAICVTLVLPIALVSQAAAQQGTRYDVADCAEKVAVPPVKAYATGRFAACVPCEASEKPCACEDSCSCSVAKVTLLPRTDEGKSKSCESVAAQLDETAHLRRAAEHLAAAGRTELARQVGNEAVLAVKLEQLRKLQAEVDALRRTSTGDQTVTLNVKILELQVSKLRRLGFDFQSIGDLVRGHIGGQKVLMPAKTIDGFISALRQNDLVKVIAEPTLVTMSGRPASFRYGGEFPILVPQGEGRAAIEYREFGTSLDFLPIILGNGNIRLELRPTISEIDPSRTVMIQGTSVPVLRTRTIDTVVEMKPGQSLVFGGLTQQLDCTRLTKDKEETALLVTVTVNLGESTAQASSSSAHATRR